MTTPRQALISILSLHCSGWLDNGKDNCHCMCGHKASLGEFHGDHVADEILKALFVADLNWGEPTND